MSTTTPNCEVCLGVPLAKVAKIFSKSRSANKPEIVVYNFAIYEKLTTQDMPLFIACVPSDKNIFCPILAKEFSFFEDTYFPADRLPEYDGYERAQISTQSQGENTIFFEK